MNPSGAPFHRQTWASVDVGAIESNVRALAGLAAPAEVCAVVKADGYGHGAVASARAALAGGATRLGVGLVVEAAELRASGVTAPVLLLSEPPPGSADACAALGVEVTVYSEDAVADLADAARRAGRPVAAHLKVNTGMNRVGAPPEQAAPLAKLIAHTDGIDHVGTWTHFAVADEPDNPFTPEQRRRFDAVLAGLRDAGIDPGVVHAANSAALLADADSYRYDMVRPGITVYGLEPSPALAGETASLRPALTLRSRLSTVRRLSAGEAVSYGQRYRLRRPAWVGTVPIGYADGVPRRLGPVGRLLVGGRRRPIAGTVTMDQMMVDLGDDGAEAGDEVVLIGAQGAEAVTAAEWAHWLDTITYEVTCAVGRRVPRTYVGESPLMEES